ncbi:MAG: hypothetical protein QMC98_02025 [Candidatus Thermoplasmatota archaeon]|nr:hypothetical protein [Candidatus Thermoplasmatota archaeon]
MREAEDKRLEGSLVSYVLAQEDLELRLEDLRKFLRAINIELDLETLRKEVYNTKKCIAKKREWAELEARLFTKEGTVRKYRFGSDFCPKCKMYKNYEKECPYCKYLEMTK